MISRENSDQEEFWAGEFGDDYINRNESIQLLASNIDLFSKVFASLDKLPISFLEVGANIGMNFKAIKQLVPEAAFTGIEINAKACEKLSELGCNVLQSSILDAKMESTVDLVLSKGVLIHLNPNQLEDVYRKLYDWSHQFILIAEYYNPSPISITYRGFKDKLFKRDFAGEILDAFPDLVLRDFGFTYHRGKFPQDDITWFLLEKKTL